MSKESKQTFSELHLPHLKYLDLSFNDIDARETEALTMSLKQMPQMMMLDLHHNSIKARGAMTLFESLQYTPKLELLYLECNNIEQLALGSSFQPLPIKILDLTNNGINSEGAIALSSSFQYMPKLIRLEIKNNPIGPVGLEAVFRNLHHLPELFELLVPTFPRVTLSAKFASVFQIRKDKTLVEACIKSFQQNGLWKEEFCEGSYALLSLEHIKDIVRVAATYPSSNTLKVRTY